MMKNKLRKPLCLCLVFIALTAAFTFSANAADDATRYQNSETGYRAVIIDELDLLTDSEESQLALDMAPITAYGNIAFWTTMESTSNEIDSARLKRKELFGFSSAGIFAINMSVKKLTIQSYGDINSVITDSYARSITDNVKNYASTGDYYTCAQMAFQQIYTKLDGGTISEPLKVTGCVVFAVMIALILALGIAFSPRFNPLLKDAEIQYPSRARAKGSVSEVTNIAFVGKTTTYRPPRPVYIPSGSSGGSSCSSCSSGSSCSSCSSGSSCSSCSSCGGGGCGSGGSSSF